MDRLEEIEKRIDEIHNILDIKEKEWWDKKRKTNEFKNNIFVDDWDEYCKFRQSETDELSTLSCEMRMLMIPVFSKPMTEMNSSKILGDVYTLKQFIDNCKCGGFIDYDGSGTYAKEINGILMESNIGIYPSDINRKSIRKEFTHVIWYNR